MKRGAGTRAGLGERRAGRAGGAGRAAPARRRSPPSPPAARSTRAGGLAGAIGRKLACAPRLPDACRHHPLVPAYGWPLARLARALAPAPLALPGPPGLPLVPVDFRRCRRESCAVAAGPHLTASRPPHHRLHRARSTAAARGGWVEVVYWLYRPALGWERLVRRADPGRRRSRRRHRGPRSRTTPPWSRSRPSPAATTTSSRPANARPGSGGSPAATPAGRARSWPPAAAFSLSASSCAWRISPRQSVVRKTSRIAAKPSTTDQAAIAIWVPTEKERTAVAGRAVQGRDQQRLLGAGAARGEGDDVGDRLHAHHQHHVADRAADPEGLEEEPEGGEAEEPADPLPGGDLAQVAARLGEDHHALPDPGPEAAHAVGEQVDADRDRQQGHADGDRRRASGGRPRRRSRRRAGRGSAAAAAAGPG